MVWRIYIRFIMASDSASRLRKATKLKTTEAIVSPTVRLLGTVQATPIARILRITAEIEFLNKCRLDLLQTYVASASSSLPLPAFLT